MSIAGVVVNGKVELDEPGRLPEGLRVSVEECTVPPPDCTYEEHLAMLRESIAEAKAGKGRPAREVLKEMASRHNLPLDPGE
jgi:hypothetical protein